MAGLLSKLFKPFKKIIKKIGKGIKKVAKKIGKAIGKLGIVGQIGMMFLMPYAGAALSSFFGAAGSTISGWGARLLAHQGFGATAAKALGHTLNAVHSAGTFIGNVYNNVTDTISKAWDKTTDFFTGGGKLEEIVIDPTKLEKRTLVGGEDLAGIKIDVAPVQTDIIKAAEEQLKEISITPRERRLLSSEKLEYLDTEKLQEISITPREKRLLSEQPEKSILDKTKDLFGEALTDAKTKVQDEIAEAIASPVTAVTEGITGGFKAKASQEIGKLIGLETPEGATYNQIQIPEVLATGRYDQSMYSSQDFTNVFARAGNSHLGQNFTHLGTVNSIYGNSNNDAYNDYMTNFAQSMYASQP